MTTHKPGDHALLARDLCSPNGRIVAKAGAEIELRFPKGEAWAVWLLLAGGKAPLIVPADSLSRRSA